MPADRACWRQTRSSPTAASSRSCPRRPSAALDGVLPGHWSHANPIDVLGDADPERYAQSLELAAKDPGSDGLLVILTPQAMTDPTQTAERLKRQARLGNKPILASWMGGAEVAAGEAILDRAGIPTFPFPDTAAQVFCSMWRYSDNLRALYETPTLAEDLAVGDEGPGKATAIVEVGASGGADAVDGAGIEAVARGVRDRDCADATATGEDAAARIAGEIGFPVVLKLHSETVTHKTDVGGVRLNLADEAAVRDGLPGDRGGGAGACRRGALSGGDGAADGPRRGV